MTTDSNEEKPELTEAEQAEQKAFEIGACFFSLKEASEMMDVSLEELEDPENILRKKYRQGWLQAQFDLRKSIFIMANSGSSPAQTMALQIQKEAMIKLLD